MKKLSTLKIVATLLLGIMLYSCGSSQQEGYVKIIPDDVSLLVSADLASIYDKAGLDESANDKYKQMFLEEASSELSESSMTLIKEVLNDSDATGIDLDAPVYFFMDDPEETTFGIVAKMDDKDVFTSAVEKISTAEGMELTLVEKELFSFYNLEGGDAVIAFNENSLLFITSSFGSESTMAIDNATRLFHLGKDYSITSSKAFDEMLSKEGDIKLITRLSIIPKEYTSMLSSSPTLKDIDLSNISYITGISFDKGEINFYCSYYTDDAKAKSLLESNQKLYSNMSGKLLKKIPATSLAILTCNMPGKTLWEEITKSEEAKKELDDIDEDLVTIIQDFVTSIDGDIILAPVSFNSYTDFSLLMYADMNSKGAAALEAIYNNRDINSGIIEKSGDNQYTIDAMFLKIYMGIKDGMFYLTNRFDESICKDVSTSASSRYADASGKTSFMAIDCAQVLKVCNSMRLLRRTPSEVVKFLEQLETLQASSQKDGTINFKITLANDDINSLKFFFDYGVQILN